MVDVRRISVYDSSTAPVLEGLRRFRERMAPDFRFDRMEANERGGGEGVGAESLSMDRAVIESPVFDPDRAA